MPRPTEPLHVFREVAALLFYACLLQASWADTAPPPPPPSSSTPQARPSQNQPPLSPRALDELLAPIALYPDPLIALILPASTLPSDLTAASAYLAQYGDAGKVDTQPWDPSVCALAHYPTVLTWMADNLPWTQALGEAFRASPGSVMDSVQRLRARANEAGALQSTPQQQVILAEGGIEILPAESDSIYVPAYDTNVVYSDDTYYGYAGPFLNFGSPFALGAWLSYSVDWRHHRVWAGGRNNYRPHSGWRPPLFEGGSSSAGHHPWHPNAAPANVVPSGLTRAGSTPIPRPMPGAPNPPPGHYRVPRVQPNPMGGAYTTIQPRPRSPAPPLERPRLGANPGTEYFFSSKAAAQVRPPEPAPRYAPAYFYPRGAVTNAPLAPSAKSGPPAGEIFYRAPAAAPAVQTRPAESVERAPVSSPSRAEPARAPAPAAAPDTRSNQPSR